MNKLDANRLRFLLNYDPETGQLTWLRPTSDKTRVGDEAGCPDRYRRVRIDGRYYLAHRLAWLHMTGEWPTHQIDHINGDKLDNRWSNLREATAFQNSGNCGPTSRNTSGHRGVTWVAKKRHWQVTCGAKYVGVFQSIEDAAEAYATAARQRFGEFARL